MNRFLCRKAESFDEVYIGEVYRIKNQSNWKALKEKKMKKRTCAIGFMMVFALPAVVFAGLFKVYPGAQLDDIYEARQSEAGSKMSKTPKVIIFTTNDFFENVVAFYRGIAREYRMPGREGKSTRLSSGQELKETYFILDDAGDIMTSKHWIKIQRPYLVRGRMGEGFHGKYEAVRDVTAIIEEDKRSYP
jgi:hypothetical protein